MANRFRDDNIEDAFVTELVGLPTRTKKKATPRVNIDPTGFGGDGISGFQTAKEIKAGAKGIKEPGASLAREFRGLRPKKPMNKTGLASTSDLEPIFEGGQQIGLRGEAGIPTPVEKISSRGPQGPTANFGLPTDRLPTIEELGGALGGIAKYVSQLTKRNRARGLTPGIAVTKTRDKAGVGLTKAKLSTLTKLHETATLSGDSEKAARIEAQLNAILQGDEAGAFDLSDDLEAIAGL